MTGLTIGAPNVTMNVVRYTPYGMGLQFDFDYRVLAIHILSGISLTATLYRYRK